MKIPQKKLQATPNAPSHNLVRRSDGSDDSTATDRFRAIDFKRSTPIRGSRSVNARQPGPRADPTEKDRKGLSGKSRFELFFFPEMV